MHRRLLQTNDANASSRAPGHLPCYTATSKQFLIMPTTRGLTRRQKPAYKQVLVAGPGFSGRQLIRLPDNSDSAYLHVKGQGIGLPNYRYLRSTLARNKVNHVHEIENSPTNRYDVTSLKFPSRIPFSLNPALQSSYLLTTNRIQPSHPKDLDSLLTGLAHSSHLLTANRILFFPDEARVVLILLLLLLSFCDYSCDAGSGPGSGFNKVYLREGKYVDLTNIA